MSISFLIALSLAGVNPQPQIPDAVSAKHCSKGWVFRRGQCWRRTYDEAEDQQLENDFYEWLDLQLDRRPDRRAR